MQTNRKAITPIVASILLIVVAVILVTIVLNWGRDFSNKSLATVDTERLSKSNASEFVYTKAFSDGIIQFNYAPPDSLKDQEITITGYKIFFDNNETAEIVLDSNYTLSQGLNIIPLTSFSDQNVTSRKMDIQLKTSEGKYITLNSVTNNEPYVPEPYVPQEYVVGPLTPGTASNDASIGVGAWSNIDAIKIEGDTDAAVFAPGCGVTSTSNYIKVTNFEFNIPSGATIDGIKIDVYKGVSGGLNAQDYKVNIIKSSGSLGTVDYSKIGSWPSGYNEHFEYGGSSDKWDEIWTAEDINDPDFGVAISVTAADDGDCRAARIDYVTITIYYTN